MRAEPRASKVGRRGALSLALAGMATGLAAQPAGAKRRIGILTFTPNPDFMLGFVRALRQAGYEEGRNLEILVRDGAGRQELTDQGARELVQANVEVIVVWGTGAGQAALRATDRITIVAQMADPLGSGLVKSLGRPERNLTGVSSLSFDLAHKRVALLKEALSDGAPLAFVALVGEPNAARFYEISKKAVGDRSEMRLIEVAGAGQIEAALTEAKRTGVRGVTFQQIFNPQSNALGELTLRLALPAIGGSPLFAKAGGLMAMDQVQEDSLRRLADYVVRVLAGEVPANLPIQQPTRTSVIINLTTARKLGITLPPALLARADDLIE